MASSKAAERLARVAGYQTLELTHYGRKSGQPYQVTIWYLVEGGRLYLVTANAARNWVRNVKAKPKVSLRIGGETFAGKVREVADPAERERVAAIAERKYWWAAPVIRLGRMLSSAGIIDDNSAAFEVELTEN